MKQVIDAARRVTGRPIKAELKPRRPGDPPQAIADATLAGRELRWQPRFGKLDAILETAWNWIQR